MIIFGAGYGEECEARVGSELPGIGEEEVPRPEHTRVQEGAEAAVRHRAAAL